MKTDTGSGEADEPPEKPPRSEGITKISEIEENAEREWARRHVPRSIAQCPESRKDNAVYGPGES
jgi:hypothetical protein